jgi:hypothetical protein
MKATVVCTLFVLTLASCVVSANGSIAGGADFVRFDEGENPTTTVPTEIIQAPQPFLPLSVSLRLSAAGYVFPPNPNASVAGWMYLNLDNHNVRQTPVDVASQNRVIV